MHSYQGLKLVLHAKCVDYIDQRIKNIHAAYEVVNESGNNEMKSSAGDKHETGRAMMQLEQEKIANQLSEAIKIKNTIIRIDPKQHTRVISVGSLVITNKGNFYIGISAGKLEIGEETFHAISPSSPLALKLFGLKVDQQINFNGQVYKIIQIV